MNKKFHLQTEFSGSISSLYELHHRKNTIGAPLQRIALFSYLKQAKGKRRAG